MKKTTKTIAFLLALIMTFTIMPQMTLTVSAAIPPSSDYIKVTENDDYNEDGKFYKSFTIENYQEIGYINGLQYGDRVLINAKLVDSSGKQVTYWQADSLSTGKRGTRNFGYDFSTLSSGKYTFIMTITVVDKTDIYYYSWTNILTYDKPVPSFSYKSYEAHYDDNGNYVHKVYIQTQNMKGHKLHLKIYNEYGDLVDNWSTSALKSDNATKWFTWDGYSDGYRNPSGNYTFVITSSANKKVVEKTLYLNIREAVKG